MSSSEKTKTHTHQRIIDGHHREDFSISIIINNNNRKNRENATLVVSTTAYTYEFDPFEFKRRENLSPFLVGGILRERDKIQTRKEEREFERARAFSLSLLPSRNQWKTRSKKRPRRTRHKSALRKNTKGMMHHRSSRLKRERKKKNRMNCSKTQTHNFGRPSFVSLFRDRRRPERRDGDRDQRGRVVVFVAVGSRAQISRWWLRRRLGVSSSSRCWCWDAHDFR